MRWFLDMNLIVYYSFRTGHYLEEKARLFVKKKENSKFLICEYIQKNDIPKWTKRQEEILKRFNAKSAGQKYKDDQMYLFKKDKISLNRLILMYEKSKNKESYKMKINKIFSLIKVNVIIFLEKYIDEFVIPINDIDRKLWSSLNTYLQNISDAKTIASAIQEHKRKELKIITADKKDWKRELLEEVYNNIFLRKEYPRLPKIEYLQNL